MVTFWLDTFFIKRVTIYFKEVSWLAFWTERETVIKFLYSSIGLSTRSCLVDTATAWGWRGNPPLAYLGDMLEAQTWFCRRVSFPSGLCLSWHRSLKKCLRSHHLCKTINHYRVLVPIFTTPHWVTTRVSAKLWGSHISLPPCGHSTCFLSGTRCCCLGAHFRSINPPHSSAYLLGLQPVLYCMRECHISQERTEHSCLDCVAKPPVVNGNRL